MLFVYCISNLKAPMIFSDLLNKLIVTQIGPQTEYIYVFCLQCYIVMYHIVFLVIQELNFVKLYIVRKYVPLQFSGALYNCASVCMCMCIVHDISSYT